MKWYGDEWLYLRDAYGRLTYEEQYVFQMQSQIPLIGELEMAYINGAKRKLAYNVMFFHALNEALRKNPEKYKPIFEKRGLVVDYKKIQQEQKRLLEQYSKQPKNLTMFG